MSNAPLTRLLPVLALAGLGLAFPARADDPNISFSFDLPFGANQATPVWLGHPETPARIFTTLDLPITPPDSASSLLVTVVFTERSGSFLRLTWTGPQGAQLLVNNFYEGIAMGNRRSLLVPADLLHGGGTLSLQSGDSTLGVQHLTLEWLQPTDALVSSAVHDLLVTPQTGPTVPAPALDGQLAQDVPAAWTGRIVDQPLTSVPQRIEEGLDFSVDLPNQPNAARLVLQETGLPWGWHLVVWINQKRAGILTPAVPDLKTDGFFSGEANANTFVGWRDGSVYLPGAIFKAGIDTIQLSPEADLALDAAATPPPQTALAIKNFVLQLDYPPSANDPPAIAPETNAPAAVPPTVTSDTPSGPLSDPPASTSP